MSIEFIGYIGGHHASEIHPRSGPTLQPDYVETVARAHEEAGFDRALVAFHSNSPDSTLIASHAASVTKKTAIPDCPPPRLCPTDPGCAPVRHPGCVQRRAYRRAYHHRG